MVLSNVILELTTLSRSFVFCKSSVQVSAGLTFVNGMEIAGRDLAYRSLAVLGVIFKLVDTRRVETGFLRGLRYANVSLTHSLRCRHFS